MTSLSGDNNPILLSHLAQPLDLFNIDKPYFEGMVKVIEKQ